MSNVKQVIVIRTQYPDGHGGTTGLRKGKMIAQGSHAAMAFLTRRLQPTAADKDWLIGHFSKAELAWINTSFAKVTLQVQSEDELIYLHESALAAGLESHLITDSGKTEFDGVPTNTAIAIGPDYAEKIDKITGEIKLY